MDPSRTRRKRMGVVRASAEPVGVRMAAIIAVVEPLPFRTGDVGGVISREVRRA